MFALLKIPMRGFPFRMNLVEQNNIITNSNTCFICQSISFEKESPYRHLKQETYRKDPVLNSLFPSGVLHRVDIPQWWDLEGQEKDQMSKVGRSELS